MAYQQRHRYSLSANFGKLARLVAQSGGRLLESGVGCHKHYQRGPSATAAAEMAATAAPTVSAAVGGGVGKVGVEEMVARVLALLPADGAARPSSTATGGAGGG